MSTVDTVLRRSAWSGLTAEEAYRLLQLRCRVFVEEQGICVLEPDGRDLEPDCVHHWVEEGGRVLSVLRVLAERDGQGRRTATAIGRVATAPEGRGRGLAGRLVDAALADWAADPEAAGLPVEIHAQAYLEQWYADRFGFRTVGDPFQEAGVEHVLMVLDPGKQGPGRV